MAVQEILESIGGRIGRAGVQMVFGEPHTVGARTVIPVAKVAFGFGGGGGEATPKDGEKRTGSGGGGGAGGWSVPVAVVEISSEGTRVLPIVDVTRLRLAGFACLSLGLWVVGKAVAGHQRGRTT